MTCAAGRCFIGPTIVKIWCRSGFGHIEKRPIRWCSITRSRVSIIASTACGKSTEVTKEILSIVDDEEQKKTLIPVVAEEGKRFA